MSVELNNTTSHRLSGGQYSFRAPAIVFGHLVKLAMPVLKEFHSDLYYDCNWIREHTRGLDTTASMTFHYYVSESHTVLCTEPVDHTSAYPDAQHWVCTLSVKGGIDGQSYGHWWTLDITAVPAEPNDWERLRSERSRLLSRLREVEQAMTESYKEISHD